MQRAASSSLFEGFLDRKRARENYRKIKLFVTCKRSPQYVTHYRTERRSTNEKSKMSLFESLTDSKVASFVKLDPINTDNFIFKLHYIGTVTGLIVFSVLLSLNQVGYSNANERR